MSLGVLLYSFIVIGMGEATLRHLAPGAERGLYLADAGVRLRGGGDHAGGPEPGSGAEGARAGSGRRLSTRSALIWMSIMGVVFFFFGEQILRVFTDDPG